MVAVQQLAITNDMKISIEVQPKKKNFICFYKRFDSLDGSTRVKTKKIGLSKKELEMYQVEQLSMEIAAFLFMP